MRRLAAVFIAFVDMLLCVLAVTMNVPAKANVESLDTRAEFVIKVTWPVTVDADVDNWLQTPRGIVFYKDDHRQVGCVTLDMDNHGFEDSRFTMLDGTVKTIDESTEVITIRCKEPGHYHHAVHLFGYVGPNKRNKIGLGVHVEFASLNPAYRPLYATDVILDSVTETINDFSFDIDSAGNVSMAEPPLKWITDPYYRDHAAGRE